MPRKVLKDVYDTATESDEPDLLDTDAEPDEVYDDDQYYRENEAVPPAPKLQSDLMQSNSNEDVINNRDNFVPNRNTSVPSTTTAVKNTYPPPAAPAPPSPPYLKRKENFLQGECETTKTICNCKPFEI